MEKDQFLKARVSSRTKIDFDEICRVLGVQPTTKLREIIEGYVEQQYGHLSDRLTVHIYRPSEYDHGAWRVKMTLRNPTELEWAGAPVPFAFPELSNRRLRSDEGYVAVVSKEPGELIRGGQFLKGVWQGHLYSNGIAEGENPTSIEDVQAALTETVTKLIERFKGNP